MLNPGGNRWQFKPELALSVPYGKWDFEAFVNARFFTKNDAFPALIPGSSPSELSQKAFYGMVLHAVYNINSKFWAAADIAVRIGGETKKNGIYQDDSQRIMGVGATINYSPSIHHQVGASYMPNAARNDAAPDGSVFGIKYTYVFGAKIDQTIKAMKAQ